MADNTENLTLKILQNIQAEFLDFRLEVRKEFSSVKAELGAIQTHLAGFHGSLVHHRAEIAQLDERLRRVEQRLGLDDPNH